MPRKPTPFPTFRYDRLTPAQEVAGRFIVERKLGRGTMGAVYVARDARQGVEIALKVIGKEGFTDEKSAHRFQREGLIGQRLHHPGIVRALDAGYDDDAQLYWIAMELAPGVSLDRWLKGRPPGPSDDVVQVLVQLFEAVAAAHDAGVVHRDLKPENVLVADSEGGPTVKVLDFGIAKSVESKTAAQTMAGLGTPLWTAPEQVQPDHVPNPRDDVWSLGLMTFHALTGRFFWKAAGDQGSLYDLVQELLTGPIPAASVRARELGIEGALPTGFDVWFALSVTREPRLRYGSAGQALAALRPVLGRAGAVVPRPSLRPAAALFRLRFTMGLGLGVAVQLLAAALWLLLRGP